MRALGIDYGDKNVGLALGENGNTIPLDTLHNTNLKFLVTDILKIVKAENIETIVVGIPIHKNSKQKDKTLEFIEKLREVTTTPIKTVDEYGTSKEAFSEHFVKHSKIKKTKKQVHTISAEKILQSYYLKLN